MKHIGIEIINGSFGKTMKRFAIPENWTEVPTEYAPMFVALVAVSDNDKEGTLSLMAKMILGDTWQYLGKQSRRVSELLSWTLTQKPTKVGGQVWRFWAKGMIPHSYKFDGKKWRYALFKPFEVALPQYAFADCFVLEFLDFTVALAKYLKTQDQRQLPKLLATIMRPIVAANEYSPNPRIPYTARISNDFAEYIAAYMPYTMQVAALTVLLANMEVLSNIPSYAILFPKDKDADLDDMDETEKANYYKQRRDNIDIGAWRKLFNAAAAVPGLGNNIEKLHAMPLHTALAAYCDHLKQQETK